jgi:hypothetical protein
MQNKSPTKWLIALVVVLLVAGVTPAMADTYTFDLSATGGGINISAVLTGTPDLNISGAYDITGMTVGSLSMGGSAYGLTLLQASPGAVTYSYQFGNEIIQYDNVYYPAGLNNPQGPYPFDTYGLGFALPDATLGNLYASGGNLYVQINTDGSLPYGNGIPVIINVTAVPEPGILALLGLGSGLLGLVGFRPRMLLGKL